MGVVRVVGDRKITSKVFGNALELYYKKGMHDKVPVGEFLNGIFKLNDPELKRLDMYSDGCRYFKEKYVKED
jgi:hypothetical protein